jgi:hypothetical protein
MPVRWRDLCRGPGEDPELGLSLMVIGQTDGLRLAMN